MLSLITWLAFLGPIHAQGVATLEQISPKNGPFNEIPMLGFGTWMLWDAKNCTEAVAKAIEAGYRHFDGATAYENQACVGAGLKEGMRRTGLKRSDLWITSKLWSTRYNLYSNFGILNQTKQLCRHGSKAQTGLDTNLQQLGLDYIDLSLMHFPIGTTRNFSEYDYVQTWKEMEKLVAPNNTAVTGKTRFIGISNFNVSQLEELLKSSSVKPKVTMPYNIFNHLLNLR